MIKSRAQRQFLNSWKINERPRRMPVYIPLADRKFTGKIIKLKFGTTGREK